MESSRVFIYQIIPCAEYSANNAFNYNGTNGNLNNNNKNNSLGVRGVLELGLYEDVDLEDQPIPLSEFYSMYRVTKRHKANKPSHLLFRLEYPAQLRRLCYEINIGHYTPTTSIAFIIEFPCVREVIAAAFCDRIAQTLLVQELLPELEKYEHPHSYSCRVGKGSLAAVERLQELNQIYRDGYVIFWDLANFFMSIDVEVWVPRLIKFMEEKFEASPRLDAMKRLAMSIYYHRAQEDCIRVSPLWKWDLLPKRKSRFYTTTGVDIGNVSSQTIANFVTTLYLMLLDELGVDFSFYTDDAGMFTMDPHRIIAYRPVVEKFLWDECRLRLHSDKNYIQPVHRGFNAFGFRIKGNNITPSKRIVHNFRRVIHHLVMMSEGDIRDLLIYKEKAQARVNSYLGIMRHAHSFRIRKEQVDMLLVTRWGEIFEVKDDYGRIAIKKNKTTKAYYIRKNKKRRREINLILNSYDTAGERKSA